MIRIDATVMRGGFTLRAAFASDATVTGVFGRSGAGKSTLLHAFAGIVPLAGGSLTVAGESWEHLPAHRRRAPVVFQEGRLFPHLSVAGNLRYALADPTRFAPVVELLELGPLLDRAVAGLSGGERQRVAIGRAVLAGPRLLLLDEPLAAIDRGLKRRIIPYLRRVRDDLGVPMVHVSHDLGELLQLAGKLVLLDAGRVAGCGSLVELCADPTLVPLLHDLGLANPLRGRVVARDDGGIAIAVGPLLLHGTGDAMPGETVDLSVDPAAIALADGPLPGISMRNQWPGRVLAVTATPARTLVTVDVGVPLVAEVSRPAIERFALAAGQPIHVLCKSQAVRVWDA